MEDKYIYDKVNLIDRYDLTCVKNELEIKINNIDERVENIEETLSDHIVEMTVYKKDICNDIVNRGFEINELNRKLNDIKKNLHLNIMCLDDDITKIKKVMKKHDYDGYIILFIVFVFHFLIYLFS